MAHSMETTLTYFMFVQLDWPTQIEPIEAYVICVYLRKGVEKLSLGNLSPSCQLEHGFVIVFNVYATLFQKATSWLARGGLLDAKRWLFGM